MRGTEEQVKRELRRQAQQRFDRDGLPRGLYRPL